jgi:hypothetical protein
MAIEFVDQLVAGTVLVRDDIESQNYAPGSAGWIIRQDGSAELNNVKIRNGTVVSGTALYYNGTPGPGTLILSIAAVAGTDEFGNAYPAGLSVGNTTTRQIVLGYNGSTAAINFSANNGHGRTAGTLLEAILNAGAANEYLSLQMIGPSVNTYTGMVTLQMNSQNEDGSSNANAGLYDDSVGVLQAWDKTGSSFAVPLNAQDGINVTGLSALVERANATDTAIRARVVGDSTSRFLVTADGVATTYANQSFATYTPAVGNGGSATFTTQTGWYQRIGKMVYVCVYLVVNAAGSGTGIVTVDMPTPVYRGTRQALTLHTESIGPNGSHIGDGEAVFFVGGTGATADRLRTSSNDATNRDSNVTGADLLAGGIITIQGWYREA